LLHLVLESHTGRALVPIPKRSACPVDDVDTAVMDSLKVLDPEPPIREADLALRTPKSENDPKQKSRVIGSC
jgi:hypothetical protein